MDSKRNKHDGCIKGFHQLSRAWYGKLSGAFQGERPGTVDVIMVGFYHPQGGTTGEFAVRWFPVGSSLTPHLEVFDDAWHALANMPELISAMAEIDGQNIAPDKFSDLLKSLGFTDMTAEVQK